MNSVFKKKSGQRDFRVDEKSAELAHFVYFNVEKKKCTSISCQVFVRTKCLKLIRHSFKGEGKKR